MVVLIEYRGKEVATGSESATVNRRIHVEHILLML